MDQVTQLSTIEQIVRPVLESQGYRLVERELVTDAGRLVLRIYIDREGGVTIDDCSEVSRTLSAHLDVEDPIPGAYELEVSSPGIERPLRYPEDFERYKGEVIKLKTAQPINGRQNYKGVLTGSDATHIHMEVDGVDFAIPFSELHKARIIKDWGPHKK